jgi:hypothetical protein
MSAFDQLPRLNLLQRNFPMSARLTLEAKIAEQRRVVNAAYRTTNSVNPLYDAEFDKCAEMVNDLQIMNYKAERGLMSPDAKTPYDRRA